MSPRGFHLAQFNMARLRAPIDEPSRKSAPIKAALQ
jgi:hypothetical protein